MPKKKPVKKTSSKKFSWKKHISDTIHEYKKFFIVLLVIMGLAFGIGVVRAIFLRGPCPIEIKEEGGKKIFEMNYRLK